MEERITQSLVKTCSLCLNNFADLVEVSKIAGYDFMLPDDKEKHVIGLIPDCVTYLVFILTEGKFELKSANQIFSSRGLDFVASVMERFAGDFHIIYIKDSSFIYELKIEKGKRTVERRVELDEFLH
ncbi:MAG: hypothetical protein WC663_01990 [Patescibacteria group bacterium]